MKTLYLIGNGFDLACGLPSRYSDYFNNRFSAFSDFQKNKPTAIDALEKELHTNGCKNIPSAWFFVFAFYHDQNKSRCVSSWKDVESIIERFISGRDPYTNELNISTCRAKFDHESISLTSKASDAATLIREYELLQNSDQFQNNNIDIYKLFLKELKSFEADFRKYLSDVVKESSSYEEQSDQLFKEIAEARTPIQEESSIIGSVGGSMIRSVRNDQYVLSFNFTNPLLLSRSYSFANIHGSLLDENGFFGIGGTAQYSEMSYLPSTIRFSKAERSLSLGVIGSSKELDSVLSNIQSLEENLRVIKFFGLSLGEADYPYLKQFFDKACITDANAGVNSFLGFYYTHGQDRDDLIYSIDSLLQRYSFDTGHKPIGGLMRELQNTGRLAVEELEAV